MDWGQNMKLIIYDEVRDNIIDIYKYIARNSIKYAQITANNIYSSIFELKNSPYLGRYVPEIEDKRYLEIFYKNYRIVYEISQNTIYILFVVHAKRDFNSFYKSYIRKNKFYL